MEKRLILLLALTVGQIFTGLLSATWQDYNIGLSDEEALEQALALSLQEAYNGCACEDEALAQAIQESWNAEDESAAQPINRGHAAEQPRRNQRACCLENVCPICMEDYNDGSNVSVLPCKHSSCTHCINRWFEEKITCPVCIGDVDRSRIVTDQYKNLRPSSEGDRVAQEEDRARIARNRPPAEYEGPGSVLRVFIPQSMLQSRRFSLISLRNFFRNLGYRIRNIRWGR